jgi:Mn2+/Fe2+ NRAMP family transporter
LINPLPGPSADRRRNRLIIGIIVAAAAAILITLITVAVNAHSKPAQQTELEHTSYDLGHTAGIGMTSEMTASLSAAELCSSGLTMAHVANPNTTIDADAFTRGCQDAIAGR